MAGLSERIAILARLMHRSQYLVVFTGAGISTESGLRDFRGPDGVWTRRDLGLETPCQDFAAAEPNAGHRAIARLDAMGKLAFLISQNVDNLHIKSGISAGRLAEIHGNLTKVRCTGCQFIMDRMEGEWQCPICGGTLVSTVVDFGQPLPESDLENAYRHSRRADLFLVAGSSLVVYPAADMPRVALEAGATLVIINQGKTPYDAQSYLRFDEAIGDVLPPAVTLLERLISGS